MRRLMVFGLCLFMSALFMALMPPPAAVAAGWEWRQTDWTGGPGQAAWYDSSRYDYSTYIDTCTVPGTLRLSHLSNHYTKDASNPVVAPGAAGDWDPNLIGYPRRREGGGYEVLYRGYDVTSSISALGYASSDDGVTWTKYAGNPVLERSGPAPAWDMYGVGLGPILDEGDHYTMLFEGGAAFYSYGLATSSDLKNWTRTTGPVFEPGDPSSWERGIYDLVLIREGGGYRLWYLGYDAGSVGRIGTATSDDGLTWVKEAGNPVLGPDAATWDAGGITSYKVLERPWAGDLMMVYSAYDGLANFGVGIALSPDGVTWTKHAANPVIVTGGVGSWNERGIKVKSLTFDGSLYKMTFAGADASLKESYGEAYSNEGLLWFDSPFVNPVLPYSGGAAWDNAAIDMETPFLEGDTLRALYTGSHSGGYVGAGLGTATAAPGYPAMGSLTSSVFDVGQPTTWGDVTWDEVVPAGCSVVMNVRTGDVPVPDGTWSGWTPVANGAAVPPGGGSRYIQYEVTLNGAGSNTPEVSNIAIDLTAFPVTWYFAEGYTGSGFDEWITIQNPIGADAHVWVTYYTPSGVPELRPHTVPANSRYNIYVNSDLGEGLDNSFKVESDIPIVCERPMYFRYIPGVRDWQGGSDAMGSTQLSRQWYFAEGCTAESFDEYLTIQNPNPDWATVDVTYFVNGGEPIHRQHRVAPTSRYTILVDDDAGPNLEVSAMLQADQPILAERPMYFDLEGMDGGHIVMGSAYLARDWYLAEGATYDPFTEYITIQNPNQSAATVAVEYQTPAGVPITTNHTIAANSRFTLNARTDCGVDAEASTYVHSNLPILVERPMYFNMLHGGLPGGHCAVGVNSPSYEWFFGEGYTGPGFDTFITVQNPGGTAANLHVTYFVVGGTPLTRNHTVDPHTRYTIGVGQDAGENLDVSTYVSSDQPVICERPMYFFYQGYNAYNWAGGHDSQGFAP